MCLSSLLLSEFSCQGDSPNPVVYSPEMDLISQPRSYTLTESSDFNLTRPQGIQRCITRPQHRGAQAAYRRKTLPLPASCFLLSDPSALTLSARKRLYLSSYFEISRSIIRHQIWASDGSLRKSGCILLC
jgi:hypothetical protein